MSTALQPVPPLSWIAGTERLPESRLKGEQDKTLATPRRRYGFLAKILFWTMDLFYGRKRSLRKFKVLEIIARMPYQAWENVAYVAITHIHSNSALAKRIFERVEESRHQQDNEQWHLLILTELIGKKGIRRRFLLDVALPQLVALIYYHISWLLYVIKPSLSYNMNADFEDHAEHEYMTYVSTHPDLDQTPFESEFHHEFGTFSSLGNLFRQIGHDERVHKLESLARAGEGRFT